jgi:hypothetical protein
MSDWQLTNYCLFKSAAIFFVLSKDLPREGFDSLINKLQSRAGIQVSAEKKDKYWQTLEERIEGKLRWDRVVPLALPREGNIDEQVAFSLSQHNVPNMLRRLPFLGFTIDSITYVIDVFNPKNELDVEYAGAGESVVALLLHETERGKVTDDLRNNLQFYSILREFDEVLAPRIILGMNSSALATWVSAYLQGRVPAAVSSWSFLFPLTVIPLPKPVGDVALARYFKRFEHWKDGRVLLQVKEGLDHTLSRAYADAAKVLQMKAIQELNPDM